MVLLALLLLALLLLVVLLLACLLAAVLPHGPRITEVSGEDLIKGWEGVTSKWMMIQDLARSQRESGPRVCACALVK